MKVELEDLRLGISAIMEECQVGIMDKKNPNVWKHKKEIHNDFLHAVVTCWAGKKQTITQGDYKYEISVKKTKIEKLDNKNNLKTKKNEKPTIN